MQNCLALLPQEPAGEWEEGLVKRSKVEAIPLVREVRNRGVLKRHPYLPPKQADQTLQSPFREHPKVQLTPKNRYQELQPSQNIRIYLAR